MPSDLYHDRSNHDGPHRKFFLEFRTDGYTYVHLSKAAADKNIGANWDMEGEIDNSKDEVIEVVEIAALLEISQLKEIIRKKEEYEAIKLKESYNHANCKTVLDVKAKIDPALWANWEAGRSCGFHSGYGWSQHKYFGIIQDLNIALSDAKQTIEELKFQVREE